jgi:putative transposase
MHAAAEDPRPTHLLRRCTYAGRPFGADELVDRIESKFGRKWRREKLVALA